VFGPGRSQGNQSKGDDDTHSTASASISSGSEGCDNEEDELTVRLIDFGRALCTCCTGHTVPLQRGAVDAAQQVRVLDELYGTQPPTQHSREVRYEGEVSCKGYQCLEMQRRDPWSYQVLYA
jgi:hypothetical protein